MLLMLRTGERTAQHPGLSSTCGPADICRAYACARLYNCALGCVPARFLLMPSSHSPLPSECYWADLHSTH